MHAKLRTVKSKIVKGKRSRVKPTLAIDQIYADEYFPVCVYCCVVSSWQKPLVLTQGAGMAQWREHSPLTNVARVRFRDSASYVSLVCCWFSSLLRVFFYEYVTGGFSTLSELERFGLFCTSMGNFCDNSRGRLTQRRARLRERAVTPSTYHDLAATGWQN